MSRRTIFSDGVVARPHIQLGDRASRPLQGATCPPTGEQIQSALPEPSPRYRNPRALAIKRTMTTAPTIQMIPFIAWVLSPIVQGMRLDCADACAVKGSETTHLPQTPSP